MPVIIPRRRSFLKPFLFHHVRCLQSPGRTQSCTTTTKTTASPIIEYSLTHPIYTIWAANTSLGKTLVSAGLSISFLSSSSSSSTSIGKKFVYLKPVQTGFPEDSDSRFVYRKYSDFFLKNRPGFSVLASNHVFKTSVPASNASLAGKSSSLGSDMSGGRSEVSLAEDGFEDLHLYEERELMGLEKGEGKGLFSELLCKTMYGWKEAISPHLAAEREGAGVEDHEFLEMLNKALKIGARVEDHEFLDGSCNQDLSVMSVIETAGGVASPGPSGTLQCDLYRPFRLPAILVGDGRLGGISGTISAYESLKLRGYDIVAIVFEDNGLINEVPLSSYLQNSIPVLLLPPIPKDMSDNLIEWFGKSQPVFSSLKDIMVSAFLERVKRLNEMQKRAHDIFWWPFTQHEFVPQEKITVIDSRCGENFSVYKSKNFRSIITQQFDGSASWWTQGPDAKLQIELARTIGYTTARYGHVMFPEKVYEPVLECSELLLNGVGKGWAARAYYSDNGSTAVEIALKMAFRKFLYDHGIHFNLDAKIEIDLKVLALRGCYHGDTLGAMEAQAPSAFTGLFQQPWYSGRGLFLDPPTVFISDGVWKLQIPKKILDERSNEEEDIFFDDRDEIFKGSRDTSTMADIYSSYISKELSVVESGTSTRIGTLIIEPVLHGAGGMEMIDPLFQRILIRECRSRKIPVIFDEVFTGFWRLGVECASRLLQCQPDISCFSKLMTGGTVPLSAILASKPVFEVFSGDSKLKALLHGHSYTAHAIGCSAAVKSIQWFKNPQTNKNMLPGGESLRELWDQELVHQISSHPAVCRVLALGTVCALELRAEGNDSGYASRFSNSLLQKLVEQDGISLRPLGNVIYIMCTPCTLPQTCNQMLKKLYTRLDEFSAETSKNPLTEV